MVRHNFLKISVIIPTLPNESVKGVLKHLKNVDYPKNKVEIFVITGFNPSKQRNEGIKKSTGSIILFLDNDSFVRPDYLKHMLSLHKKFDIVGGPALTLSTDTFIQKCFGYVLGSYFATQKMQARFRAVGKLRYATEKELILCNLSIKKKALDSFGGFDERLYPNEENE